MKFLVPTEYCLIIKAFSQASTLRGAAELLGTDPAALVRKVQHIHNEYGLLEKIGNRWTVTSAGQKLAHWTEEAINSQKLLLEAAPRLRISAFAWLTEEMLIPNYATLDSAVKTKLKWSFQMSGTNLEQDLIYNRTDFVIHGKAPNDPNVAHRKISAFPWVTIAPYSWKNDLSGLSQKHLQDFLNTKPFCRHADLNPATVLNFVPEKIHDLILDGVIGLRSAIVNELGWSAVPAMSIQTAIKEKKVLKLNLPITYRDDVSVWWMRSRREATAQVKQISSWIQDFRVL